VWVVVEDSSAPSGHRVLAQTDADPTGYRFPVCVLDSITAKDYYVVRANALENNVVLYKVQNGKRTDLPLKGEGRTYGKKIAVPSGAWSTLGVNVKGNVFEVLLNGAKLYEVEDPTFPGAGKVGLWTKADSVIRFDDLRIVTH